jgi:hypothetical protein
LARPEDLYAALAGAGPLEVTVVAGVEERTVVVTFGPEAEPAAEPDHRPTASTEEEG